MQKYIIANFKTNKNSKELDDYFKLISNLRETNNLEKVIFLLNSLYVLPIHSKYTNLNIGIQSGCQYGIGSFTSSVAIEQIAIEKIEWIILGHSEEFKYFHETLKGVNEKLIKALDMQLKPIVCIGNETQSNEIEEIVDELIKKIATILNGISDGEINKIIWAYEPIAAIGTNQPMNPDKANKIINAIKEKIEIKHGIAPTITYGGSVNIENIRDFLNCKNIDGVLVGKQSLDPMIMKMMISENK